MKRAKEKGWKASAVRVRGRVALRSPMNTLTSRALGQVRRKEGGPFFKMGKCGSLCHLHLLPPPPPQWHKSAQRPSPSTSPLTRGQTAATSFGALSRATQKRGAATSHISLTLSLRLSSAHRTAPLLFLALRLAFMPSFAPPPRRARLAARSGRRHSLRSTPPRDATPQERKGQREDQQTSSIS